MSVPGPTNSAASSTPDCRLVKISAGGVVCGVAPRRSEEHSSELQSPCNLVCRLLLEKKKNNNLSNGAYLKYSDKAALTHGGVNQFHTLRLMLDQFFQYRRHARQHSLVLVDSQHAEWSV